MCIYIRYIIYVNGELTIYPYNIPTDPMHGSIKGPRFQTRHRFSTEWVFLSEMVDLYLTQLDPLRKFTGSVYGLP